MNLERAIFALLAGALTACSQQATTAESSGRAEAPRTVQVDGIEDPRCWYGGCEGPFYSAAPMRFGRFELHDRIDALPAGAVIRGEACDLVGEDGCVFSLPDEGIEYLVVMNWVARKQIRLPMSHALPFGLHGNETRDELVRVMRNLVEAEPRIAALSNGRTLITHEGTLGTLERPEWLDFELDENGRFDEITWQGPPTT